jgi:hAT family C-terminal dimerisation region
LLKSYQNICLNYQAHINNLDQDIYDFSISAQQRKTDNEQVNENMEDNCTNIHSSENNELSLCSKSYANFIQYFANCKYSEDDRIWSYTNVYFNTEVQVFTRGRRYSLDSDPLITWTKLSLNLLYMNLAEKAIDVFSVPAATVVVERLFSRMGDIISAEKSPFSLYIGPLC